MFYFENIPDSLPNGVLTRILEYETSCTGLWKGKSQTLDKTGKFASASFGINLEPNK